MISLYGTSIGRKEIYLPPIHSKNENFRLFNHLDYEKIENIDLTNNSLSHEKND